MPAPLVGRRFGIQKKLPPMTEQCHGIKALGISGSSRQQPAMSKTERFLRTAIQSYKSLGCTTTFFRLKDLTTHDGERNYSESPAYRTYPCQSTLEYEDDELQKVYDVVLGFHVPKVSIP